MDRLTLIAIRTLNFLIKFKHMFACINQLNINNVIFFNEN